MHGVFKLSPRISLIPVCHGCGDFAVEVRRLLLTQTFDCLAVPLPASFQERVETAIEGLPSCTAVIQDNRSSPYGAAWTPDSEQAQSAERTVSYVPIDPCQAVIAALRFAIGEHMARAFIDLETAQFEPYAAAMPDAYALKRLPLEQFAAAVLPAIGRVPSGQPMNRIHHMAKQLKDLEQRYESIVSLCNMLHWPWLREAYQATDAPLVPEHDDVAETLIVAPDPDTLIFMLGELPFITGLYERARRELDVDDNLSIDGVKELLIESRQRYRADYRHRARKITPHALATCLKYVRNLTLLDRRLTPDLYNLVVAAQQVIGDGYALHVAQLARSYPYHQRSVFNDVSFGIDRLRLPDGEVVAAVSRLPGSPVVWRSCQLLPKPDRLRQTDWQQRWNPYAQCSWPPEDDLIENFRTRVADRARAIMGADLIRTEKFTTSIKDGIDIRDTLRNWHTGELYVKELPPSRGRLDAVVMLFDSPADPRDYPWRTTWFAEHQNESTLAFFATDFQQEMAGPGIGLGTYGGAMFLFPPIQIPEIWCDSRLDFTETLEERLLAAACLYSECPHVALLSTAPPGAGWRKLARRYKKKWVHVPLGSFGDSTVQQLRMVHVLNGKEIRSYAAHFIRKA